MPGYKTHLVGGGVSFIAVSLLFGSSMLCTTPAEFIMYLSSSLIGSIFPDIDVASKMQRLFFIAATAALSCALLTNRTSCFLIIGGSVLLVTMLRHRTLTHQVSFLIGLPLFCAFGSVYLYQLSFNFVVKSTIFFITGCLSHILLDRTKTNLKRLFVKR